MPAELIQALQRAEAYPHEVGAVRVLETHISWVILTGRYAYKIKKPVDLGFLDFSALDRRKYFCIEELRLNRRFSSSLYLDVVPITGSVQHPVIGGGGKVIEYAVKMREFSQDALLENMIARGDFDPTQLEALGVRLADFHKRAERCFPDAGECDGEADPPYGSLAAVISPALENFDQIRLALEEAAAGAGETLLETQVPGALRQLRHLEGWTRQALVDLEAAFGQRKEAGFIRHCHGDLHLRNIVVIDGNITFFDCIEFDGQLRWIDTVSELAFLLMDLEVKEHTTWANRVLNTYLEHSGDYRGLRLLPFYKIYRALVRAKINILRFGQCESASSQSTDEERKSVLTEYRRYGDLAERYTQVAQPFLAIMHGVSGSGKSTVAAALAGATEAIRLRSDVERKRVFGLDPYQSSRTAGEAQPLDIYTREATEKTFDRLAQLAGELLSWRHPVIVDATFLGGEQRERFRQLAQTCAVPFAIIACRASAKELVARLEKRGRSAREVSEADTAVLRSQLRNQTPLSAEEQDFTIEVNTEEALKLDRIVKWLADR